MDCEGKEHAGYWITTQWFVDVGRFMATATKPCFVTITGVGVTREAAIDDACRKIDAIKELGS